jgi:LL-diaminopimelate aminotransferase
MTGWRVGFAVGNASAIGALVQVKSNVDSGQFHAVRRAGAVALRNLDHPQVCDRAEIYRKRRTIVVEGLRRMGLAAAEPRASFYVWARCPAGYSSMEFAARVLQDAAVVLIPGVGFGEAGESYFRIALTVDAERTQQAMDRMLEVNL